MTKAIPVIRCRGCDATFTKTRPRAVYCSDQCAVVSRTTASAAGCVIWMGAKNSMGYGQLRIDGVTHYAHRVAAAGRFGDIDGKVVCHSCDTPLCCNPDHMFIGDQADNVQDMLSKGRQGAQQLDAAKVREIRALKGTMYQHDIAAKFGVALSTIEAVLSGRHWSHVK